ncbi:archease family protein [Cardiosporidium cionae]|uniref:Archease family protein n=1 Tax=Cardiosporidium cionae TaxID=476202 RepID=A0ABQ7J472_9APIC|nr:archease family protein [Cardiosporidium cionae]|eukprot:KAF8817875.1 archease family protein [Cardiosporidium cionae]
MQNRDTCSTPLNIVIKSYPQKVRRRRYSYLKQNAIVADESGMQHGAGAIEQCSERAEIGLKLGITGKKLDNKEKLTPKRLFDYLDHSADVIIHSWGESLQLAFGNAALGLFNYISSIDYVQVKESRSITATGHDTEDLLYHFMDEMLYLYGSEYFLGCQIDIFEFNLNERYVCAKVHGEIFDNAKHQQGTEVKAITMHEMRILNFPDRSGAEIFVLVDI